MATADTEGDSPKRPDKDKIVKDKMAVALAYKPGEDDAPRIAAKGKGFIAQTIIDLAKANGIEIREDPDLVVLLSKLDIDMPIPLEAYAAVAEIIAYVYKANARHRKRDFT